MHQFPVCGVTNQKSIRPVLWVPVVACIELKLENGAGLTGFIRDLIL